MNYWKSWRYKNLTLVFVSILATIILLQFEKFHSILLSLGNLGYIGAFFAGMLFVSTFTVSVGSVLLLILAEKLSTFEIGVLAGLGAVTCDFLIFRFTKNKLLSEFDILYKEFEGRHLTHLFHSKYFSWLFPVFGAIVVASPLPDELGVTLMGISKMKTYQFLILSFILNVLGISLIVSASNFIKP